jgi:two-component system osmolarity sensor histidine kinase EnvZ
MTAWVGMISRAARAAGAADFRPDHLRGHHHAAALTHSAPERRELLFDLVNEGIRVFPLEEDDRIEPPPDNA